MLSILMLVFGIYALAAGKLKTKTHEVTGTKARLIGLVLVAYLPVTFAIGIVLGIIAFQSGNMETFEKFAFLIDLAVVIITAAIALVLFNIWKQPVGQTTPPVWPTNNPEQPGLPLDPNNPYASRGTPPQNPFGDR
ncbi:MAG: hypothetical protein U0894_13295 [Pirellulales bacterium]